MVYRITEYRDRPHSATQMGRRQVYALTPNPDPHFPGPVRVLVKDGKPLNAQGAALLKAGATKPKNWTQAYVGVTSGSR